MIRGIVYQYAIAVGAALVGLAFMGVCGGCAGSGYHDTLNAITDVADPAYGGAVAYCDALEGEAIEGADTRGEAEAAVAEIRERCDVVFAAFQALRSSQLVAREAVEDFEAGDSTKDDLDAAVKAVQATWTVVQRLLTDLEVL